MIRPDHYLSMAERREAVLGVLRARPGGLRRVEIAEVIGISSKYCTNVLSLLRNDGLVEAKWCDDGAPIWRIPRERGGADWFPEARFDGPGMTLTAKELAAELAATRRPRVAADVTARLLGDPAYAEASR